MWGFVVAMAELADQFVALPSAPAAIWHAASSGGTTAGIGWATDRLGLDVPIVASSVGETQDELLARIDVIWDEAMEAATGSRPDPNLEVIDEYVGLGYGRATDHELRLQAEATSLTGQLYDPTYTGKALYALRQEIDAGRYSTTDHVIFWHTGGGFATFAHDFSAVLAP